MNFITLRGLLLFILPLMTTLLFAEGQLQMHDGLEALRRARNGTDAAKNLHEARKALAASEHDKAHYRKEAMSLIDKALGAVESHDMVTANKAMDEAIEKIEKGIEVGKNKKKKK